MKKNILNFFKSGYNRYQVKKLQKKIRYNFKKETLLLKALQHPSLSEKKITTFDRLEFLGDAILGMIVSIQLYQDNPEFSEGKLSIQKSKIVSKKYLATRAKEIRLGKFIFINSETTKISNSILEDALEALIGAIYLDSNLKKATKFVNRFILKDYKNKILGKNLINYKKNLQEFTQSKYKIVPNYKIIKEKGPEHEKIFYVEVFVKSKKYGSGKGKSKKAAEQDAAKSACISLNINS